MTPDQIKREIQTLPPITPSDDFWTQKRLDIRHRLEYDNIEEFLTWPSITTTMVPGETQYMQRERSCLKGLPIADFEPYLIHQAYHLARWEATIESNILHRESFIEIGGGFGAMYEVLDRFGWRGDYTIIDFPEMLLLQRYYLESRGIPTDNIQFLTRPDSGLRADMLIALWSLSEMPIQERRELIESIKTHHGLFAFQDTWEGADNREFFSELSSRIVFEDTEIPGHRYGFI